MNTTLIRPCRQDDAQRIWKIRNEPCIRQQSIDFRPIDFNVHRAWFDGQYFSQPGSFCFVVERGGIVLGYCRYDRKDSSYRVSISIDPAYHGQGHGTELLNQSLSLLPQGSTVTAEIKKGNPASLRLFQKNSFTLEREDEEFYYLRHET